VAGAPFPICVIIQHRHIIDTGDFMEPDETEPTLPRGQFRFPGAVAMLAIVTILVWVATLFIPAGRYQIDADGSPILGTFRHVPAPLSSSEMAEQLVLSPINGVYGLHNSATKIVDTETVGRIFGQVGIIVFIMAIGAFISVSFATRSLEVAVGALAQRLLYRGWLLIASVMVLFSLLGSTMGFSAETLGFYALFIPLMTALGYDRLATAAMIIIGALVGVMASTVNPFSIGVAAGEAGVSLGDGIVLRVVLWVVLTGISIGWVLRYAAKVRRDPTAALAGWGEDGKRDEVQGDGPGTPSQLTSTQKCVLAITALVFGLMIFSVVPWSSMLSASTGPADYYGTHEIVGAEPLWFELDWWFPQLAMLFILASVLVGFVARMGEAETVRLIKVGAADMMGPALVVALASGVSVIMNNTQTLDTILNSMEKLVSGVSPGVFVFLTILVNVPLAALIPSSSGHGALAMPLLAPLADFAQVSRSTTITAWVMGHGLALLVAPTSVVLVGGLAIAKVGYQQYLRFVWPLLLMLFIASTAIIATLG
jgi:uncharacterized ion transporter superfamily protein YfcC